VDHHTTIHEVGEGGVQAVCSCGWRSPVFGADKTAGTMDPLQRAADAGDLHEWGDVSAIGGATCRRNVRDLLDTVAPGHRWQLCTSLTWVAH